MTDAIKRMRVWAHWKLEEIERSGLPCVSAREFVSDIELLLEARDKAEKIIRWGKDINPDADLWLNKFGSGG